MLSSSVGTGRRPPTAVVRLVVHAVLGWMYCHTMWMAKSVDWNSIDFPTVTEVGKFMVYMLTLWTLNVHLAFFVLAAILDFFELLRQPTIVSKLLNKVREINDFIFMTIMLPLSICVCSGFWFAWILFNDLIYPSEMNNIIPVFINHVSHTTPIFVVYIELIFCYHASPRVKSAISSLVIVETIYLATIIKLKIDHGRWVYLLIDIYLDTIPKFVIAFSFLSYIIPIIYLVSSLRFNNYIWGIQKCDPKNEFFRCNKKIT